MDKIIHHRIQLMCESHQAFEMFTGNQKLTSWLACGADVEPMAGGKFELFWDLNNKKENSTLGCRITAMEPDQFLSFEWRSPKQFKHFANRADPLTHVVVFFIPGKHLTDVHLIHSGWRCSAEWDTARQWQDQAWGVAFKLLGKLISAA